jgi:hypothetical protein
MYESVVLAVLAATVKVTCQVVSWRREVSRERERARLVLGALRLVGHGARMEDRRPDGGVLTVLGDSPTTSADREGEAR